MVCPSLLNKDFKDYCGMRTGHSNTLRSHFHLMVFIPKLSLAFEQERVLVD